LFLPQGHTVNADFLDAHRRHLRDADTLWDATCLANADHLYGMAAECGLKRLMIAFGMTTDGMGTPTERKDKIHIDAVWDRYDAYRSGHVEGLQYGLPPTNPFNDWSASQRYAPEQNFDRARVKPHRIGAHTVTELIQKAKTEGLL
jgi:hypothetical protein